MCFAPQWRALFRNLNFQKWSEPLVFLTFWLPNVLRATTACTFSTSELPKVVRTPSVLTFWLPNVHFFDISTAKSGPELVCFVHFDFEMCFAPQFFDISTSKNGPKLVCFGYALYILTSTCDSRHDGLQFFISHLASWLRTRRFSEPTFRPSGAANHWKNAGCFATFLPFHASASSFFLLFFLLIVLFSLPLPCSAFHLSISSEVWLLNFLRSYISYISYTCIHTRLDHVRYSVAAFQAQIVHDPCWPRSAFQMTVVA